MESIDHFIQQQKEMLQMEKNNLGFLESAQTHRTLEHANHARMVDDSTSIDCDEDDDLEKQRILQLEKDAKDAHNCSLSNDSDKGKKHFEEQVSIFLDFLYISGYKSCYTGLVKWNIIFVMESAIHEKNLISAYLCHS